MDKSVVIILFTLVARLTSGDPAPHLEKHELQLTQEEKDAALAKHNEYRRKEGASNMVELVWSEKLEAAAQEHANKCVKAHSTDLQKHYKESKGESLSFDPIHLGMERGYPFVESIDKWYGEKKHFGYNQKGAASCRGVVDGEGCGHFQQIVWAYTYEVGCARAVCPKDVIAVGHQGTMDVCQYRPAGLYRYPPYLKGEACTECDSEYHKNPIDDNVKFPLRTGCCDGLCCMKQEKDVESKSATIFGSAAWIVQLMAAVCCLVM